MYAPTILVLCLAAAAYAFPEGHIVGGHDAAPGKYKYQVSLKQNGRHFCGGSIINARYILTAAHCVDGIRDVKPITVQAGTNQLSARGTVYGVEKITAHPNYDAGQIINDVAVIRVNQNIAFNNLVQPINLASSNVAEGSQVVLSGWGTTRVGGPAPDKLQEINLKVYSQTQCQKTHSSLKASHICTFTKSGEGACHGDSGGPLVHQGTQVGVVSYGRPCGVGYPDVFTRVSSFLPWIKAQLKYDIYCEDREPCLKGQHRRTSSTTNEISSVQKATNEILVVSNPIHVHRVYCVLSLQSKLPTFRKTKAPLFVIGARSTSLIKILHFVYPYRSNACFGRVYKLIHTIVNHSIANLVKMYAPTILVLCLAAAAYAFPEGHIVGGHDAPPGKYKYQVSLKNNGRHFCGGSIINARYILTAAHCVVGIKDVKPITVQAGTNQLSARGTVYGVEKITAHPNYNSLLIINDVAVIRVNQNIAFNNLVQPINLASSNVAEGSPVVLSGWGTTKAGGQVPDKLQEINLKVYSQKQCKRTHLTLKESHICSFTKSGEGACNGDSGGPLVHQGTQVGIVSYGRPCGIGYPDVYTRVSSFLPWIKAQLK
ncbi:transmembrane protease serine 9 [Lasioglossum baleicum]|uniref:transmembrane protease serine 9 n=1 Tax=Lasioglossum baleicum TaxID=434251 RepID=UPI003FCD92A1